jgi:hypothetical protein
MTTSLSDDYAGPFDAGWSLERLSRAGLARLCREYQMLSMFHDRAFMPHVASVGGTEGTVTMADGEWMGSSPIYTRRNLDNVGVTDQTVSAIAKGIQFDIGGPDHYLDFRFEVVSDTEAFFWTEFCGPHDHLRRMTDNDNDTVQLMCHDMEDRTFDATFSATNPKARCEPVFRPPRPDEFTGHHCRWRLFIDDEASTPPPNPSLAFMQTTAAASFPFGLGESREPGGLDDYSGPLLAWFRLEDFSHAFLVRQAKEYAMDVHLLMRASYWTAAENWGADFLADAAPQHRAAFAPGLVARLRDAMGIEGDDIEAMAKILQLDPVHVPEYSAFSVAVEDDEILVSLADCAVLHDDPRSPLGLATQTPSAPGFEHKAPAVYPRAQISVDTPPDGAIAAWRIWIDPAAEPVEPHPFVDMVNLNDITTFDLSARPATPVEITPRAAH